MNNNKETPSKQPLKELQNIVLKLRDPINGCPWDLQQTNQSLIPHAIEEAYEVADAIRRENDEDICDELGDLLLQVFMHAQIASEDNRFSLNDVARSASEKMIRRHPHVFGTKQLKNIQEVNENWESIKEAEQSDCNIDSPFSQRLKTKTRSQSALSGAAYISRQVSQKGLNWEDIGEGYTRIKEAFESMQNQIISETLIGELIFAIINLSDLYKINLEEALAKTNIQFIERIRYIETNTDSITWKDLPIKKLKSLWERGRYYLNIKKI